MYGYRFYEEFTHKRKGLSAGNAVAVNTLDSRGAMLEAFGAVFERPNSPIESCTVDPGWLRAKCRRISESRAREIHPQLFYRLDSP